MGENLAQQESKLPNESEVNNNQQNVSNNINSEFVGVARRAVKRLYLGGAREGATTELVTEYMELKGISPTFIRIFKSKRKGTVAIRVNVTIKITNVFCKMIFGQRTCMLDHGYHKPNGRIKVRKFRSGQLG